MDLLKKALSAIMGMALTFIMITAVFSVSVGADIQRELRLICKKESKQIENMHWNIYRIGEKQGNRFVLIGDFADYPIDFSDINEDNIGSVAQTLESFVIRDAVTPLAGGYTDADGTVSFSGLKSGIYLAIADKIRVGMLDYRAAPLLAEITDSGESVFPKIYESIVASSGSVSYTVKKVWLDNDNSENVRPESITVDLYGDGTIADTVTLDESNGWMHEWSELDSETEWRIVERDIPKRYSVLISGDSNQFLIENTLDDYTVTTTTTTTTTITTTAGRDYDIPQTGQLWWPVFILSFGGLMFIVTGLLIRRKTDKNEK